MLVFLRTLYGSLSRGIESLSLSDAFFSILCGAAFSFQRCRGNVRCAIRRFFEDKLRQDGFCFAGCCNLPARNGGAAKRRSGFRPREF